GVLNGGGRGCLSIQLCPGLETGFGTDRSLEAGQPGSGGTIRTVGGQYLSTHVRTRRSASPDFVYTKSTAKQITKGRGYGSHYHYYWLVSAGDSPAGSHTLLYPSQDVEARYGFINDYPLGCSCGLRHFYN